MPRIFEGSLSVDYAQAYVCAGELSQLEAGDYFKRQENGLCGASIPHALWLVFGMESGEVGFTIDVLDAAPPLDDSWEEIVEVPFAVAEDSGEINLLQWPGEAVCSIPLLPGNYRVRYCARGMDEGHDTDTILDDEPLVDFYSLTFWPAENAKDRILKQTSEQAQYWDGTVAGQ